MLEAAEGELVQLSESATEPSGELRVTAPAVLSNSVFTEAIASFAHAYPRIRLSLDFSDSRRDLIDDGFDIAIRMGFGAKNTATSRVLFQVERKLVASVEYLTRQPAVDHPKQLEDWDWLVLTPVQNIPVTFRKKRANPVTIKPTPQLSCNDAQALYRLVRAGAGIGIVPGYLAEDDVSAGRVEHLLPEWENAHPDVFAVWPANAPKHGLVRLLLDDLSRTTGS